MPFAVPVVWREQSDHVTDCYFCMTAIRGFSRKNKSKISYPVCKSAIKPVSHSPDLPVPQPPAEKKDSLSVNAGKSTTTVSEKEHIELDPSFQHVSAPLFINQERLNDLVRDLYLSKEKAEILGSRLQQWNLLEQGTTISSFRSRNQNLAGYYASAEKICYCKDIGCLMSELRCEHNPADWRLFIDSSKTSLKAVLLHNGNIKPSILVGYSILRKETYNTMKILLNLLEYPKYTWKICSDLKVVSRLLGLQLCYTKHMCFLCVWDSRQDNSHYAVKVWPPRQSSQIGKHNVQHQPLVCSAHVLLPPLHIKLGLMKNFVKAMDRNGDGFKFLKDFCGETDAKLKAGVFVGPEIRKLMQNEEFGARLNPLELAAWNAMKSVVINLLGSHRHEKYRDIVNSMLKAYEQLGARMSLKMHFLHFHLDFFPSDLGEVGDEQGERFNQDISVIEERYQGRYDANMMGDFCWYLQRESKSSSYKGKAKCAKHF